MHDFPLLLLDERTVVVGLSVYILEEVLLVEVRQLTGLCTGSSRDE